MTNTRQSGRQQHLSPEQHEREDIHQPLNNLVDEHRTNQSVLQRALMAQQHRIGRITTPRDVDFTEQESGTPDTLGAARLSTQNHLQATMTLRKNVSNTAGKRPHNHPRGVRRSRSRDSGTPEQLTSLLRRQQSLLEKYYRRLQRLQRTTTPPIPDNLEFRIREADQPRHGLGYTSSDQEGR
ncbi:hypothetical protein SARC_01212 [Sphaeroforma arctica JP610]|uniref:Uncharacterized protein n=1 Tax=Sphaeroforma arctica JP610 TaxID=667725 RepID=A0A0L0GCB0_9EUKA|nr:hypothetical protein SARC_01212 [Sphaeroforma arctica JP610]KNC86632.1 hypothetical protein SARC_01212 [Sphaeroforma arctica JP610]|eukprot:XP_014160534.1 hypothetical protein SARC_01212 [Sphaeroforma arctica JP610]